MQVRILLSSHTNIIAMEICEHFIDEAQIIGIGPLLVKETSFGKKNMSFSLYLKNYNAVIELDCDYGENAQKDFANQYRLAKQKILSQVI